jgi:hypothetical protein
MQFQNASITALLKLMIIFLREKYFLREEACMNASKKELG